MVWVLPISVLSTMAQPLSLTIPAISPEKRWAGQNAFLPSIAFEIGKDFSKAKGKPYAWHLKPQILVQIPHNNAILPRIGLEAGLSFFPQFS